MIAAHSLDIGSVRLTERHLAGDPPTTEEIEAATATSSVRSTAATSTRARPRR